MQITYKGKTYVPFGRREYLDIEGELLMAIASGEIIEETKPIEEIWTNAYQKKLSEAGPNDFEEYTQMQARLYADEVVRQTNSISSL